VSCATLSCSLVGSRPLKTGPFQSAGAEKMAWDWTVGRGCTPRYMLGMLSNGVIVVARVQVPSIMADDWLVNLEY
jgi:hypothetical protein